MTGGEDFRQSFGTKLQEWQLRHQSFKQRQQLARQEKENREMEQCTFRPAINCRSEFYARRSRGCFLEPLADRLHHEADKRMTLRHKAKELLQADEMCSYTFRPQINRNRASSKDAHTPIHLRAETIQQMKQAHARQEQAAEDVRADCSFQPRISGRSERIVQKKRDKLYRSLSQGDGNCLKYLGPVEDRLYAEAQELQQRQAARKEGLSEPDVSAAPSVDEGSRRICKSSVYFQGAQQDFLTRQQTFELAKQRRMEVRTQHAEVECSFRPKISDASRQIVATNLDFVGETHEERTNRLAVKDVERRDQLRSDLEQLHYRECTFKPEVSSISQMLAARGVDDGASCESGADGAPKAYERLYRSALNRSRASDDSHGDDFNFRPQLDPKAAKRFAHVKPHYSSNGSGIMDNIRQENEKKQEQMAERRREMDEQQNDECTFTPGTWKAYEEPKRPVVVSGLGRFFELKTLAQRQQQEQQDREEKVFHPELSKARFGGVTIPEPFDLSAGPQEETSQARREECTFTPQTNESANREIIRQIMQSTLVY